MPRRPPQYQKTKAKWDRLRPFMPCFFDVPYQTVQNILGVTHHTLDPLRRELGLERWPYPDLKGNNFCMTPEEIEEFRLNMMARVDGDMREILVSIGQEAVKSKLKWRKRKPAVHEILKTTERNDKLDQLIAEGMAMEEVPPTATAIPWFDASQLPPAAQLSEESRAFWDEISQILLGSPCSRP